jgi:hypothetical protein
MHTFLPFVVVWFTQLCAREFDAANFQSFGAGARLFLTFGLSIERANICQ